MKNLKTLIALALGLTLLSVVAVAPQTVQAGGANCFDGSYLVVEEDGVTKRLWTLTKEGQFLGSFSLEEDLNFSSQNGAWKRLGRLEVAAVLLDFDFDGPPENRLIARNDLHITFDAGCQTASGTSSLRFFDSTEDPLAPASDTGEAITVTVTARRITVD